MRKVSADIVALRSGDRLAAPEDELAEILKITPVSLKCVVGCAAFRA